VPLWRCTQAERHTWIRQLRDVADCEVETLMQHRAWPPGFEIVPLDGYNPDESNYRVQWRERPTDPGAWLVVHAAKSKAEAVECAFIVACETRAAKRRGRV